MKFRVFFFHVMVVCWQLFPQQGPSSRDTALEQYHEIYAEMNRVFPEDDFKTYRRHSFTDSELQQYLTQLFQLQDLIPKIKGQHQLKLDYYLHAGNWFFKIGFSRQSVDAYKDFFAYYALHEKDLSPQAVQGYIEMRNYAYGILAENYTKLSQLDSAEQALLANLKFIKTKPGIYYPSALNNYGLLYYWSRNDHEKALNYFKKAYKITSDSFPEHPLIGSIRDNIADVYTDFGLYPEALPLYQTNFRFYQNTNQERTQRLDYPRLISAGVQLASTYVELDSIGKARIILDSLQQYLINHQVSYSANSKLEIQKARQKLLFGENKPVEAYKIAQDVLALSDSIQKASREVDIKWSSQLNNIIMDRVKLNFTLKRIQQENKIKSQRLKFWVAILVFFITVTLLVSLVLRRKQHLINARNKQLIAEKTLENTNLRIKQLNSEIKSKERDLSDFSINLSQNLEWIELLAHKIEALKKAGQKEKNALLEDLEQEIRNKVNFDANTKDFFERLDKLSDAFYSKLNDRFPNLSKNEIRLCSLIRLKIDSRSIASLQNITLSSLNTSRYRLRKKLGLHENEDLDTFIQTL